MYCNILYCNNTLLRMYTDPKRILTAFPGIQDSTQTASRLGSSYSDLRTNFKDSCPRIATPPKLLFGRGLLIALWNLGSEMGDSGDQTS